MGCATSTCEACFAAISSGGSSSSGSGGGGGLSANPPCCFDRRYLSTNLTVTEARSVIEAPPGESGG